MRIFALAPSIAPLTLLIGLGLRPTSLPAQYPEPSSPLGSLVEAERAFARHSAEKGMASAFMAFLSDEAVVFRPHPVNGQEWFRSHPAPPIRLTWAPGFADISVTGDMGYTTGPWTARDESDPAAPPAYGEFVTVWKKREGNVWKVEIDLGISHPAPVSEVRFTSAAGSPVRPVFVRPDSGLWETERAKLLERERAACGDSLHPVPFEALQTLLSSEARLLRPGRFPILGQDSITAYFSSRPGKFYRRSSGSGIALGVDLAYTYGTYRESEPGARGEATGNYLTIWKKEGENSWRIVLDLQSAVPPPRD